MHFHPLQVGPTRCPGETENAAQTSIRNEVGGEKNNNEEGVAETFSHVWAMKRINTGTYPGYECVALNMTYSTYLYLLLKQTH